MGRQEDAEEFLSCVLNGIHEEMLAAVKLVADKYICSKSLFLIYYFALIF